MRYYRHPMSTPLGRLEIAVDDAGRLVHIAFLDQDSRPPAARQLGIDDGALVRDGARTAAVEAQLAAYFAGRRRRFELALAPRGTAFQQAVWRALLAIPAGATRSYAEVAAAIGRPASAARAVGRAVGTNPIPIVIPCHRVIGSGGALTGFAGGLPFKRGLLALEARIAASTPRRAHDAEPR